MLVAWYKGLDVEDDDDSNNDDETEFEKNVSYVFIGIVLNE